MTRTREMDTALAALSALLTNEGTRLGITAGPRLVYDSRLPHITTCDGMRAVDHFGRLAVEICHGWNTSRHDAASVTRALQGLETGSAPSFSDVYAAIVRLRSEG